MKRIFISIIYCLCFLIAEAQPKHEVKLRVATWNIEEFNLFKSIGQSYIEYKDAKKKGQRKIDGVKDNHKNAGVIISEFMKKNDIDMLFIQEFIPYVIYPAKDFNEDDYDRYLFEEFKTIEGLDPKFVLEKKCYYKNEYLKKFTFENQQEVEKFKLYADNMESYIPQSGEGYLLIYNKETVKIGKSNTDKHKHFKNDKDKPIRPPMMTPIMPIVDEEGFVFKLIENKDIKIFNYHALKTKWEKKNGEMEIVEMSNVPRKFADIESNLLGGKIGTSKENIIFLGDMNNEYCEGATKPDIPGNYVDYIYANPAAAQFVNWKQSKVKKGTYEGTDYNDSIYINFYRVSMTDDIIKEKSKRHFSDHNPIYMELIIGGDIKFRYKEKYEGIADFYKYENLLLFTTNFEGIKKGQLYLETLPNGGARDYKGEVEINLKGRPNEEAYKPHIELGWDERERNLPGIGIYSKGSISAYTWGKPIRYSGETRTKYEDIKCEDILKHFNKEDIPGKYTFTLKFTFNDFWYVEKEFTISVPKIKTKNERIETSIFMQKNGRLCQEPGDMVYLNGEYFIKNMDFKFVIKRKGAGPNAQPEAEISIKGEEVGDEGEIEKKIKMASEFAPKIYIAKALIKYVGKDKEICKNTEFDVKKCTIDMVEVKKALVKIIERHRTATPIPTDAAINSITENVSEANRVALERLGEFTVAGLIEHGTNVYTRGSPDIDLLSGSLSRSNSMIVAEIPLIGKVLEYHTFDNNTNTSEDGVSIKKDSISITLSGKEEDIINYLKKKLGDSPLIVIVKNHKGEVEIRKNHKVDSENFNKILKKPVAYKVTGTSTYNPGESGKVVRLDGSEDGVTYQLKNGETNVGTPVNGTGSVLSFGSQTAGTYTVVATRTSNGVTATMTGSAVVTLIEPVLYVNVAVKGGTGDGSSWANAYKSLSDALAKAHVDSLVKTIKVAAGIYKRFIKDTEKTNLKSHGFHIPDGVTMEGGYNASGAQDIKANITILSGEIDIVANKHLENHVVFVSGKKGVSIDGFTITGGYDFRGGDVAITGGGGIYILNSGVIKLTNNTVHGNTIGKGSLNGCGGGIYISGAQEVLLANNIVYSNRADGGEGGGVLIDNSSSTVITNNTFYSNSAGNGGAIFIEKGNNDVLMNNRIYNNSAGNGAGLYISSRNSVLTNNVIYNNVASYSGGGAYLFNGSSFAKTSVFINNTIFSNTAAKGGGGIELFNMNNYTQKNNIFWGNKHGSGTNLETAYLKDERDDNRNLIRVINNNIFEQDPRFENPANPANDGLRVQIGSPCIGTGTSEGAPDKDITGKPRPKESVTIGAYQYDR